MITDIRREALSELLQEIYEATVAESAELQLPQIARWAGIPLEAIEDIGKRLVEKKHNVDLDVDAFNEMLSRYRKIDQLDDAGLRAWKLQGLARKYKRPVPQLTEAYSKALVNQAAVQPLSPKEFRALHAAEVEWLVKGWIPKGTMLLLHADGGVGKTLFSYELMECVLTGKPWNGYSVKQGKVIIVQTDEPIVEAGQFSLYRPQYHCRHTFITLALDHLPVKDIAYLVGNSPNIIYKHYASRSRHLEIPEF